MGSGVAIEADWVIGLVGCLVAHQLAASLALLPHNYLTLDSRSQLLVRVFLTLQRFRSRLLVGAVEVVRAVGVVGPLLPICNRFGEKDGNGVCNLWLYSSTTHLHKLQTTCTRLAHGWRTVHMHMSKHTLVQSATR